VGLYGGLGGWGGEVGVHNLTYGKIGYGGDAGSFGKGDVSCVCGEEGLHMLTLGTIA
jgi:hypothetical protein